MSVMQKYLQHAAQQTDAPTLFHRFTGLATIGAAMANRYWLDWFAGPLFANLWIVLVAPSTGLRKSSALQVGRGLLAALPDDSSCLMPWNASSEGLATTLYQRPYGMMVVDEMYQLLDHLKKEHTRSLKGMLTSLYGGHLDGTLYRREGGMQRPRDDIALSLMGATTLEWLALMLQDSDITGGFLARMLLICAEGRDVPPRRLPEEYPGPGFKGYLVQELSRIAEGGWRLTLGAEARWAYTRFAEKYDGGQHTGTKAEASIERLLTTTVKLAMILHVDEGHGQEISGSAMKEAISLSELAIVSTMQLLNEQLALSPMRRKLLMLVRSVRASAERGITRRDLLRELQLSVGELAAVLETALAAGYVEKDARGRGLTVYRIPSQLGD